MQTRPSDWLALFSLAQVTTPFLTLEYLLIATNDEKRREAVDDRQWLELLQAFLSVKNLALHRATVTLR